MSDPTPVPATPTVETSVSVLALIEAEIKKVYDEFKADKADGKVTVSEVVQLLEDAVSAAMVIAKPFQTAAVDIGSLITTALTQFYTNEIRPLELKHFGAIVSAAVIDPLVKQIIPMLVESAKKLIASL